MTASGFFYVATRLFEFVVLIPIIGMLAFFVHGYTHANVLTPNYILVLFVTAVLGAAWCLPTLGHLFRREYAFFVGVVDLAFVGTLIAGVYLLRGIDNASCTQFTAALIYYNLGLFGVDGPYLDINKTCAMLKAAFAFGIIAIVLFSATALLCFANANHWRDERVAVRTEYHSSRHNQRRRSRDGRRGSRSGPPSRRSSHRSNKYYS